MTNDAMKNAFGNSAIPDSAEVTCQQLSDNVRSWTRHMLANVGLRLAHSVAQRFGGADHACIIGLADPARDALLSALAFAERYAEEQSLHVTSPRGHPLQRLITMTDPPASAQLLQDLLLLACLPEAHEGFAALCRLLHPQGLSIPTVALALHWLEEEAALMRPTFAAPQAVRDAVEDLLIHSPLSTLGVLQLVGDGPWHSRALVPGPGVWPALMARPPRLEEAELETGYSNVPGLTEWLDCGPVKQAVTALRLGLASQILFIGGDVAMRSTRIRALLGAAQIVAIRCSIGNITAHSERYTAAYTTAVMYQACLWLEAGQDNEGDTLSNTPKLRLPTLNWALPVLCSAQSERAICSLDLPLIRIPVQPLAPIARRTLWQSLLPQLGDQANVLAARYPIDPDGARDVVRDLTLRNSLTPSPIALDQVGECIRARTTWHSRPGIQRVLPRAQWPELLVSSHACAQLHAAVRRVMQQITVLDDWGFAQGRAERRSVRMLFFGPPGTGKTLAAEVMAEALGVDMLVVDLAALVSKWIGETEKNLSSVFDVAERSRALLLFDEADALFAKRTETQDANDRYANLETAYLLQRLERYEGVAVLTTNMRTNLDTAFARRFEYIVEFPEPDATTREALWRLHLPSTAPLDRDIDLVELAAWYPISGAQIKNAALTAAFFAAAVCSDICQHHFLLAVEREYDKAGRAHPGFPPNTRWPAGSSDAARGSFTMPL